MLISPFLNATWPMYWNNWRDRLQMLRWLWQACFSQLYYVLSGNDFTLDINNLKRPKIVCMGNKPQKIWIHGAVLSLYVTRLVKLVNKKGKQKSAWIFDEFPTSYLNNNMDSPRFFLLAEEI